ncbi:MAG: GyrI-like domain-containing protein [Pseudonocardiaceae bacterium]
MTNSTLRLEPLPALRLAQVSGEVNDTSEIGATVAVLFETLTARLAAAGVPMSGRVIRTYYGHPDDAKIDVAVGLPPDPVAGLELAELPGEDWAAVVTHRGPAEDIADAWHTLDVGLEERGLESYGLHRQVHLEDMENHRVVELQCPVRNSCSGHGLFEQWLVVENLGVDSEVGITRVRGGRQSAGGGAEVYGLSPDESDGIMVRMQRLQRIK